jgi:thioredoxin
MTGLHEVNERNFEQAVLKSDYPVLVDFGAAWCPPCRLIVPALERVAEKYAGRVRVAKLNVDENESIARRYAIKGIPTLILFEHGIERQRVIGAESEKRISLVIDKHLGTTEAGG